MRKLWLLILSCATFLALIYSARSIFITVSQGRTFDWVIQIRASVENENLQMQVSDDGPGIDS